MYGRLQQDEYDSWQKDRETTDMTENKHWKSTKIMKGEYDI